MTPADVKRVANKYLTPGRVVLSIVPMGKIDQASKPDESKKVATVARCTGSAMIARRVLDRSGASRWRSSGQPRRARQQALDRTKTPPAAQAAGAARAGVDEEPRSPTAPS